MRAHTYSHAVFTSHPVAAAKLELKGLLERATLAKIPLLCLFNKNDLPTAVPPAEVAEAISLTGILDREVSYYSISCKNVSNIDKTLEWLVKHTKK
jgi:signal recognition particle receptor subunit beta